jgi:hypothetical protein
MKTTADPELVRKMAGQISAYKNGVAKKKITAAQPRHADQRKKAARFDSKEGY